MSDFLVDMNSARAQAGKRVLHTLPKNPVDKCTIVSVFPKEIIEIKPTMFPGRFVIPSCIDKDGFEILVVESSSYYKPSTIEKMPPTEIQINSAVLAESIINDCIGAMWLSSKNSRCPGVFWIPGSYNKTSILGYTSSDGKSFRTMLDNARSWQKEWFTRVMEGADEFWARSNGNPRSIPEDAKLAAEYLGMTNKAWMANTVASVLDNCPSCGEMINLNYPVCKHCHAIVNPERAKELNLAFAEK